MGTIIYAAVDIAYYLGQGILLAMMLRPAQGRFGFRGKYVNSLILVVQYAAVRIFLQNSEIARNIIYGSDMTVPDSRRSMVSVAVSLFIAYAAGRILLKESRLKVCYYVVSFYSIMELVRFAFYPIFFQMLDVLIDWNLYLHLDKQMYGQERFYQMIAIIEVLWNVLYAVVELFLSGWIAKQMQKYLTMRDACQKQELVFLIFPSAIGLMLCLLISSIMYSAEGSDVRLLINSRVEMNVLIPGICVLCIAMMMIAAKMLRKLLDESNKRIEIGIYRNRIEEMEKHIEDIESLYAGIRGMKHDMKNYIADMDALMKQEKDGHSVKADLRQYLDSLQLSVEQLDMKFHTGNPVTDVVMQRYVKSAEKNGIAFQSDFIFPEDMNIDAFDLSIIMNNGLENAIEACKRQNNEGRSIELTSYRRENMFFIIIRNSFDGTLKKKDGRFQTTKKDSKNHGFGLQNMEACAGKYFGRAETAAKDGYFELAVMLQKRE